MSELDGWIHANHMQYAVYGVSMYVALNTADANRRERGEPARGSGRPRGAARWAAQRERQ